MDLEVDGSSLGWDEGIFVVWEFRFCVALVCQIYEI